MTTEERLARIEAYLFGKTERTQEQPDKLREKYAFPDQVDNVLASTNEWRVPYTQEIQEIVEMNDLNTFRVPATQAGGKEQVIFVRESVMNKAEQPLPPLPDEAKKYEAGFWWNNVTNLNLPDGSYLHFGIVSGVWQKFVRNTPRPAQPHTLTPVETHTVGKFYAIKGAAGEHLNDYRNYALCVGEGQFIGAIDDWDFIVVGCVPPRNVTLNEVTPA